MSASVNTSGPPRMGQSALRELAAVFLKLGATAFGGPAVHAALMEQEFVYRRKWLTHAEFLDLLGATHLIPGPNSTEMAIHLGLRRAGWAGSIVAGACFIVPAFLIVLACAWFYTRYSKLPEVEGVLYGVKPVVLAVVLQAIWRLGRTALKTKLAIGLAATAMIANGWGVHELVVLLAAGAAAPILRRSWTLIRRGGESLKALLLPPLLPLGLAAPTTSAATSAVGLAPLFLFFLKVGAVMYGSGYELLAFLRADLVERWGWLTESQLLDAIAIGQMTPGPLFTTATFVGYVLAGTPGACFATAGIFLPAFIFVAVSAPWIPRMRRSAVAGAFLDGVNAASLALMAVVTLRLLGAAFVDPPTVALGAASMAALLLLRKVNPIWLILVGAAVGMAFHPSAG